MKRIIVILSAWVLLLPGCGKKGPLVLEPQKLPPAVEGLGLRQIGRQVELSWRFPARLSDQKTPLLAAQVRSVTVYHLAKPFAPDTFLKKSEVLALNPNHIDLEAPGGALLFIRYASPMHRYKERKLPLSADWVQAYREYSSQYTLTERAFPWSPRRLEYLLEDLSNDAGLTKHLSFDMCRWTCALTDWRSGMERDKIRQKLGVSTIQWRELRMKLENLASKA